MEDDWLYEDVWFCVDCHAHTGLMGEYYMVNADVWAQGGADKGMLCVECLEERIGRTLTNEDFPNLPVNSPGEVFFQSERLLDRMGKSFSLGCDGVRFTP